MSTHKGVAGKTARMVAAGACGLGLVALLAGPAAAVSAPIRTTANVNMRPGPSTTSGNPITTIPAGVSPSFNCWAQGQNINGVDVWFNVTYNGRTGFYASYYDNSSYSTDAQITSKYGIRNCSTSQTPPSQPPPSSAAQTAANWSTRYIGQDYDYYLCLTFVRSAWLSAGIDLKSYVNAGWSSNTYPVDIWGHFTRGTTGGGTNPPVGALVFYAAKNGDRTNSHVTISVGGGREVSTADSISSIVHYETIQQHSYANYLGWWLP